MGNSNSLLPTAGTTPNCSHQLNRHGESGSLNHFLLPPGSLTLNVSPSASIRGENPPTPLLQTILNPGGENTPLRGGDGICVPQDCREMWVWNILFNQYAVGLQGRGQIFYLSVLRRGFRVGRDDQHPPARYLCSKGRQEMSNTFHGLMLQTSPFPWRSPVLSTDSTNIAGSQLR